MMRKIFALCVLLLTLAAPASAADVINSGGPIWSDGNNYIYTGNVSLKSIHVLGSVTLTLSDDCTLDVNGIEVPTYSSLTIKTPAGSKGTGTLNTFGSKGRRMNFQPAIGAKIGGNITIVGGTVNARGRGVPGIQGRNITIVGGTVTSIAESRYYKGIDGGTISNGSNGNAWIVTNGVKIRRGRFTSCVVFDNSRGTVYGAPTIRTDAVIQSGMTLTIKDGRKLTVAAGKTLTVAKGATLTLESGGDLVNHGKIDNKGLVRLPDGSSIESFGLNKKDSGVIEIGGKVVPKEPTQREKDAAKKIIDKINGADSAASSLRAAEDDPMEAEVNDGDISFDFDEEIVEGSLCTMRIDVAAGPDQYAIIANSQMVDVAPGSSTDVDMGEDDIDDEDIDDEDAYAVDDAPKGKIVYVDRFVAPKDATRSSDIELDEVSIEDEDEGVTELDATLVVVNGKASEKVQAMPEYTPSGIVDGQGLAVFYDDEFKMNVLVVFDGDPDDGLATDLIYAKYVAEETPQKSSSGGACATGAAAFVAIAALAVMERRKK